MIPEVRFRFLAKCKAISIKEKDYIAIGSPGVTDRKLKPTSSPQTLHFRLSSPLSTDD